MTERFHPASKRLRAAGEPAIRRKLYQDVLERLMERVRSGEIRPGDQLPSERDLMAEYGVGRPAVREALQVLERWGVVEITHGERARVVVPTAGDLMDQITGGARHLLSTQPDMLEHLKEARLFLECAMASLAARRSTGRDVVMLRECLAAQRAAQDDYREFMRRDMNFHAQIARMSGNPLYPAIVEAVFGWASEYHQSIIRVPGRERLTLQEHEAILEAIADHDEKAAELAMRQHLTRANGLYQAGIKAAAEGGPPMTGPPGRVRNAG